MSIFCFNFWISDPKIKHAFTTSVSGSLKARFLKQGRRRCSLNGANEKEIWPLIFPLRFDFPNFLFLIITFVIKALMSCCHYANLSNNAEQIWLKMKSFLSPLEHGVRILHLMTFQIILKSWKQSIRWFFNDDKIESSNLWGIKLFYIWLFWGPIMLLKDPKRDKKGKKQIQLKLVAPQKKSLLRQFFFFFF